MTWSSVYSVFKACIQKDFVKTHIIRCGWVEAERVLAIQDTTMGLSQGRGVVVQQNSTP